MSGKGSGRRPGEGYAEGFDRLWGKKKPAPDKKPCNNEIRNSGAAGWPRTCMRCGLMMCCPFGVVLDNPPAPEFIGIDIDAAHRSKIGGQDEKP